MRGAQLWLCAVLFCPAIAIAQPEPRGPADIIGGARKARDAREIKEAGQRATGAEQAQPPHTTPAQGAPPATPSQPAANAAEGHGAMPPDHGAMPPGHGGDSQEPQTPRIAEERANPSLPDGTIRVLVTDLEGRVLPASDVELATMSSDSTRSSRRAKTNSDGTIAFSGLAGGEKQAYRVNVLYEGAKYSSSPFRLPLQGGYEVQVRRLPVTRSDRMIVTYVGATSVELKDDRLKVVQQTRVMNVGRETYVFPDEGTLVRLPEGFVAVQTQDVMTDQHVAEAKGEGLRIKGSLPPGEVTLLWAFDLPITGSTAEFGIDLPWIVFTYRVITDAPDGMTLSVKGMPRPEQHKDNGRSFWVTEVQRRTGDQPLRRIEIALQGIPGPGNARWVAVVFALLVLIGGAVFARSLPNPHVTQPLADFEAYKAAVLARAREVQQRHDSGDIGPEFHREQMTALEDELAELLYEQAALKKRTPAAGRTSPRRATA